MGGSYVDGNHQFRAIAPGARRRRAAVPLQRRAGGRDRAAMAGPLGRRARFETPNPAGSLADPDARRRPARSCSSSTCSRTRRTTGCTSATRWGSSAPTCTPATSGWPGATCSTRWASTPSACPPSSSPCRPASILPSPPRRTSSTTASSCAGSGMSHDQRRSVETTDPGYYRWTQWIFARIFESWYDPDATAPTAGRSGASDRRAGRRIRGRGQADPGRPAWSTLTAAERAAIIDPQRLAYVAEAPVNWCPGLGTVVANEEVTADGRSDRGNFPVFKRTMRQWMMRITAYADRLSTISTGSTGPTPLKTMQRNWIGRSPGRASTSTPRPGRSPCSPPDPTPCSAPRSWCSPPSIRSSPTLTTSQKAVEVVEYRKRGGDVQGHRATRRGTQKAGVFTGSYATNPATGDDIPIWIADYVLMGYGTGAIMAVPCGDQRDFEFATGLRPRHPGRSSSRPTSGSRRIDIKPTLDTRHWPEAFIGDAPYVNSSNREVSLDGIASSRRASPRSTPGWSQRARRGDGQLQAA